MSRAAELELAYPKEKVIHLEVGQPNFATPKHIVQSAKDALDEGRTTYSPNAGVLRLREAIADRYTKKGYPTKVEQVIVTVGSSLSLYSLLVTILCPGEECLVPFPGFPNYQQAVAMVGGNTVPYLCNVNEAFIPTLEEIKSRVTQKTKCIILCNPNNPTGATYPPKLLEEIILWARREQIFVISDGSCHKCNLS